LTNRQNAQLRSIPKKYKEKFVFIFNFCYYL